MRRSVLALFALLVIPVPALVPAGLPDSKLEVKDLQNHPFAVDFPSGSNLRLYLRSGEFRIVGRSDNRIAVHLNGRNANNASELTVRFRRSDNTADLRVFGGPKNNLEVTIEVPSSATLFVRMPAGDLSVEGVSGDKDVELHFGDLTIAVGNAAATSTPPSCPATSKPRLLANRMADCSAPSRRTAAASTSSTPTSAPATLRSANRSGTPRCSLLRRVWPS